MDSMSVRITQRAAQYLRVSIQLLALLINIDPDLKGVAFGERTDRIRQGDQKM